MGCVAPERRLLFPDFQPVPERLLTDRAAQRPGKAPGLDTGHPQRLFVEVVTPQRLIDGNSQVQLTVMYGVPRR